MRSQSPIGVGFQINIMFLSTPVHRFDGCVQGQGTSPVCASLHLCVNELLVKHKGQCARHFPSAEMTGDLYAPRDQRLNAHMSDDTCTYVFKCDIVP